MRRWYYKFVGRDNKAVFVYDYLKITSDFDKNRAEWQLLGDKISYLNEFGAQVECPILSAGQQNRGAEQQGGVRNDDSTTVGASDRINQYASFNAIYRLKTLDEISEHGEEWGTHLLKPFKTSRVQGKDNYNMNKTVKVIDANTSKAKYKQNFINYEINQYAITEKGTYADIIKQQQLSANLQANNSNINKNNI
jgi:hypothetical protein